MKAPSIADVKSALPAALGGLEELALNLRWSWDTDSMALFRRLDPALWEETRHNPIALLRALPERRWAELAGDAEVRAHHDRVMTALRAYMDPEETWWSRADGSAGGVLAYFSAEYGITECLPIYSGGLGVLSGDHLKAASDLGVPLVGAGLLYREGYFSQSLDARQGQRERYPMVDPEQLPLVPVRGTDERPLVVHVDLPGRAVKARVWRAQVGRVRLYLLDTDHAANAEEDRGLTARLYGGDRQMRIAQEVVLGIGGYRALRAAGEPVTAYHMNEGHSAFLVLEHLRRLVREDGRTLEEARAEAAPHLVFTTHTPVEAGHDHFTHDLALSHVGGYAAELGITEDALLGLAKRPSELPVFCMTTLGLRAARHANGVSRLHGAVSRAMWQGLWPQREEDAVPIGHVTNGVHTETWLAPGLKALYAERLGSVWRGVLASDDLPKRLEAIGDGTLWRQRGRQREQLVEFVRERAAAKRALPADDPQGLLDPDALTIGFARRFTAYKRGALLLSQPERLAALLDDAERPVQVVFAGKAHPRDETGKGILRKVAQAAASGPLAGRIVLLEGYDLEVGRALVQGVDVWLNTPRPPLEASGTSGMKAAINGGLNLSTFDGWWAEAWREHNDPAAPPGWVIGPADVDAHAVSDGEERDAADGEALFRLLEEEVVPLFYRRDEDGLPRPWLARVRTAMGRLTPFFSTSRMVRDYADAYYRPALSKVE